MIKLRTYELERFMGFLMTFELNGSDSRLRTRFVRLLNEYQNRFNNEHEDLIKKHSNLDENGQPKTTLNDKGKEIYDVIDRGEFNKEYSILLNEVIEIEVTEERKKMIALIKEIILNCDKTFKGEEAFMYDRFCEIVEDLEVE